MNIYIEFTKPKSSTKIISQMIRFIQNTQYSHVRFSWISSNGESVVYEASGSSVRFLGEIAQGYHPVDVVHKYEINLTREEYGTLVALCMRYAGIKYGTFQILGMAASSMMGFRYNLFSTGEKTMVCSELVTRILHNVLGYKFVRDFDQIGPKETKKILDLMVSAGFPVKELHLSLV